MKTTMNLPDGLMAEVKRRAASEGRTQTSVIEEALLRFLRETTPAPQKPMPVFGNPDVNALLIDLEDKEALYAAFDEGEASREPRAAA